MMTGRIKLRYIFPKIAKMSVSHLENVEILSAYQIV